MAKDNIILVGYMGAGKTTLGKALAASMGRVFHDLDWLIEERTGKTIPQIFAEQGEDGFRQIERQTLTEAVDEDGLVLAVGGGTPCFFDNIDVMNRRARTVYLQASPETLMAHIRMGGTKRPLVDGKSDSELIEYIRQSLSEREPFYNRANYKVTIDTITDDRQIDGYVDKIKDILKK